MMKNKNIHNAAKLLFVILLFPVFLNAQDVKLRIPKSSIDNAINALINSRALSYASYDDAKIVDYYSLKPKSGTVLLSPGNLFSITFKADFLANFNLQIFNFDITISDRDVTISGPVQILPLETGYKIVLVPNYVSLSGNDVFTTVLSVAQTGVIAMLPEISININDPLLPVVLGEYFTSNVPSLTTSADGVELGFVLKAGPRYITALNDVNGRVDIGNVQDEEGTNNYVSYQSPKIFEWNTGTQQKLQTPDALLDASNGKNKYRNWYKGNPDKGVSEIAPRRIPVIVETTDERYGAKFDQAKRVQLKNVLEGYLSGGSVTYESTTSSAYDNYEFYHPTQTHPINTTVPNGTFNRNWCFSSWSDGDESQSRNVVINNDLNLTAIYKGSMISNISGNFQNPGQKKTKSDGANSILVYESMNSIWMENSTDRGTTWTFLNNYKSVNPSGIAKDPSIDGTDDAMHFYVVGYAAPDAQTNTTNIMATEINGLTATTGTKVVYDNIPGSSYETQPVVACLSTSKGQRAIMIWRQPETEGFGEMLPAGLYYRTGSVVQKQNTDPNDPEGFGNEINWDVYNNGIYITGTDINSFNPTVAGVRSLNEIQNEIPMVFHISYSQKIGDQSAIRYTSLTLNDNGTISQSKTQVLSGPLDYGAYKQLNEKPSITLVKNVPYVAWRNYHEATYMQTAVLIWKIGDTTWADTRHYAGKDDDATSVHLSNVGSGGSQGYPEFVMAWNTSYSGDQFVKSSSLSTIYNSDKSGQGIQVLGAKDFNESFLISFNNTSLPYSFQSSDAISSGTLAKVTSEGEGRTVEERSGLIKLNNFFLKASIGDLTFNGSKISFKEPKDTLVNSSEHFMRSLETETIDVSNSGILTYTTGFEYSDSLKALSFLKEGSHAGFSVELFDAESGLVLRKLNSFLLSPSSLKKEHAQSFRLDLSGIGMKKVAMRLTVDLSLKDSTKAEYFVLRHYAVQKKAGKDNFVDLNYSEGASVTEYGLSQNYPNPFNPSTVINYQIPKASKVTLRIFDMLGREVTTLVNEYKEMGRYSVEFNASSLPSGTYIYEIRANDFVKSGKMILLK